MPVHDWTRVDAGIFHGFHFGWLSHLNESLNGGLLPEGFYSLPEQHAGRTIPDILTLHASAPSVAPMPFLSTEGGTAVAEAPPRIRHHESLEPAGKGLRRTLAIRHVSGHRLVALFELVSPANKDRQQSVDFFVDKAVEALNASVNVSVVDLFPPSPFDPRGMAGAIRERLMEFDAAPCELPAAEPLTLASFVAGPAVEIYYDNLAPGAVLPEMPLFLNRERYVNLPLEATYQAADQGMPAFWRNVLEGKQPGEGLVH
jgi:hypothetical protein